MFSVIISEKGGAERREAFDRTEINVGRVQGNELMLPKGNVSKRHARLLYRDGRFIVTDLKSTNGTYVNGRKIAQATIVREGDKIYIGDFVLRIESAAGSGAQVSVPPQQHADEPSGGDVVADATAGASITHGSVSGPLPTEGPSSSSHPSSPERQLGKAHAPRIERSSNPGRDVISHFPLEHDPDDSVPYAVPGPPKVPGSALGPPPLPRPSDMGTPSSGSSPKPRPPPSASASSAPREKPSSSGSGDRSTSPSLGMASQFVPGTLLPGPATIAAPAPVPSPPSPLRRALPPPSDRVHDAAPNLARRAALQALVEHAAGAVDLAPLASDTPVEASLVGAIERALSDRVVAMKAAGELPTGVDPEVLVLDARRELLELGPLTSLLEDEDVSEIHVMGHDHVVAVHGRRHVPSEIAYTSESAVERVIRRLAVSAGQPLVATERFVERRLARGARLFVVRPTAKDQGHMVVVRKPQRADLTLDDLVRSGTISRAMAGLLAQCVAARANILVTGALGAGATSLLGALAAAGSTDNRVVVLQEDDELIFNQPHTISMLLGNDPAENARAVQAAARIRPDRLVVGAFAGVVAAEVVDAMGDGVDGVLAAARAPTLRQAAARLTADLAATRPGVPIETAREWLASAFDVTLEIARLRDGRHRVLRLAELAIEGNTVAVRDVFTFSIERTAAGGSLEGAFHATGVVPGIAEDLAARGVVIDPSIFKRHPSVR